MVLLPSFPLVPTAALVALLALAGSCSDNGASPSPQPDYGTPFTLGVGDARAVGADGLSVRFEGVANDSRCPVDVNCVWEGEATVQVRLQAPAQETRTLELRVRGTGGSSPPGEFGERFAVQVTKLEPAPRSSQPIPAGAYQATLVVTRR